MGKTDIANCIRKLRFEHDEMTQQELAEACPRDLPGGDRCPEQTVPRRVETLRRSVQQLQGGLDQVAAELESGPGSEPDEH